MNKKTIFLAAAILVSGLSVAVLGQSAPTPSAPSISDNASPLDNNIKMRSVELERIKRESEKKPAMNREIQNKYPQIKADFEGIQLEQSEIVKIYSTGDQIDYQGISSHAIKINEMAIRLRGNVLEQKAEDTVAEDAGKKEADPYIGKSVRDLIVVLDNAIGEMVEHPIFTKNLKAPEPGQIESLEAAFAKVIKASRALSLESSRKASGS